jgi:hypothetical protein
MQLGYPQPISSLPYSYLLPAQICQATSQVPSISIRQFYSYIEALRRIKLATKESGLQFIGKIEYNHCNSSKYPPFLPLLV